MATQATPLYGFSTRPRPKAPAGERLPAAVEAFLDAARSLGLDPVPLTLVPSRAKLHLPPGAKPLRVSWRQRWQLRIADHTLLTLSLPRSGLFGMYSLKQVIMPVAEERLALELASMPTVERMGLLVEQVDPILAVRVAGRWFQARRWLRRPYILSEDEVTGGKPVQAQELAPF